jgi:hypothetical protein
MSFSRIKYDECATKLHNQRSVGIGEYRLSFDNFENNNQCQSLMGPLGSKSGISTAKNNCLANWGDMAQIESDLQSRNIPITDCNENATNINYSKNNIFDKKLCSPLLNTEDTRFTFPTQSYRSMSLTSYQLQPWLFSNPQCHIKEDRIGLGSRYIGKANFTYKL